MTNSAASETWNEFLKALNEIVVLDALAPGGILTTVDRMMSVPPGSTNPDPEIFIGHGDPNAKDAVVLGRIRRSELYAATQGPDARAKQLFAFQLVVFAYSLWNDEYRPKIAKLHGVDLNQVSSDAWGDLRRIRHDIVHHAGVATKEQSGKCVLPESQVVTTVGQVLRVTPVWFAQMMSIAQVIVVGA